MADCSVRIKRDHFCYFKFLRKFGSGSACTEAKVEHKDASDHRQAAPNQNAGRNGRQFSVGDPDIWADHDVMHHGFSRTSVHQQRVSFRRDMPPRRKTDVLSSRDRGYPSLGDFVGSSNLDTDFFAPLSCVVLLGVQQHSKYDRRYSCTNQRVTGFKG